MNKLPNHTALKEWASAIAALGSGDQVVLIRKGGIADPTFGLEAQRFYLFPTNFHDGGGEPPPIIPITHWCEAVRTWEVHQLDTLLRLAPHVVFARSVLETRYRFRSDQAIHVIGVRAWTLRQPHDVHMTGAYAGCRSWVSLDEEIDVDGSTAVLGENELNAKLEAISSLLEP